MFVLSFDAVNHLSLWAMVSMEILHLGYLLFNNVSFTHSYSKQLIVCAILGVSLDLVTSRDPTESSERVMALHCLCRRKA